MTFQNQILMCFYNKHIFWHGTVNISIYTNKDHALTVFSWMALYNDPLIFQFLFDIYKTTCRHNDSSEKNRIFDAQIDITIQIWENVRSEKPLLYQDKLQLKCFW